MKLLFKVIKSTFICPLLMIFVHTSGQNSLVKELSVGDTLPNIELKHIINYKFSSANIYDFKKKLLILDFWATWCAPCVASFPKLDSLQRKFENSVQILPITYQESAEIQAFFKKLKKTTGLSPLSVTNDQTLSTLLKHNSLPHCVWVDEKGIVLAITEGKDINETNINSYLNGQQVALTVKKDEDRVIIGPLFVPSIEVKNKNTGTSEISRVEDSLLVYSSVITRYTAGLVSGASFGYDSVGKLSVTNRSVEGLYRAALLKNKLEAFSVLNIKTEILDSALYKKIKPTNLNPGLETLNWLKTNGFCYSLSVPPILAKQKYDIMLADLNSYFGVKYGIEGIIEKRNHKYLSLIRTSDDDRLRSKEKSIEDYTDKFFTVKIQNRDLSALIWNLALPLQNKPMIIDETKYTDKVDIEINCKLSDLKALNGELEKYGLKLVEKQKMMNIAVIREKQINNYSK